MCIVHMDMIKALYLGMKGILGSTGISCTVMSILKMGKNFFQIRYLRPDVLPKVLENLSGGEDL